MMFEVYRFLAWLCLKLGTWLDGRAWLCMARMDEIERKKASQEKQTP